MATKDAIANSIINWSFTELKNKFEDGILNGSIPLFDELGTQLNVNEIEDMDKIYRELTHEMIIYNARWN